MIRIHTYQAGRLSTVENPETVAPGPAGTWTWVEVVKPEPAEAQKLSTGLGLHELVLEDALTHGHPPKIEDFGDYLFVIVHTPTPASGDGPTSRKICLCLAKTWCVTILREPFPFLDPAFDRIRREPKRLCATPDLLAHALVDAMVDGYEKLIDELEDNSEALELRALDAKHDGVLPAVLTLRRIVAGLVRLVRAQRDVCHALERGHPALTKKSQPYFRDVYDHMVRIDNTLDALRETIGAVRDAHLAMVNNRLSDIMRTLTGVATIMLPLTLVTGVFGMNFEFMPIVKSSAGFWITMSGMLVLAICMLTLFRRRHWL